MFIALRDLRFIPPPKKMGNAIGNFKIVLVLHIEKEISFLIALDYQH